MAKSEEVLYQLRTVESPNQGGIGHLYASIGVPGYDVQEDAGAA
jgi:hypothetical protein